MNNLKQLAVGFVTRASELDTIASVVIMSKAMRSGMSSARKASGRPSSSVDSTAMNTRFPAWHQAITR